MGTLKKVIGFIGLVFSTFFGSGMIFWWLDKRGWLRGRLASIRGKGGGAMGSAMIGILLLILYQCHLQFCHLLGAVFVSFIVGIPAVYAGEKFMLEKWGPAKRHAGEIATRDFNETCIDEVHGMLIAVLPIYYFYSFDFFEFFFLHLMAFLAFRFFDAKKIGPVKTIEKAKNIPSPITIMLDDSVAGIFAMIVTGLAIIFVQML